MGEMHEISRAFRAMGSDCSIRVVLDEEVDEAILERAVESVALLERRWSRFLDDSELSQLNEHAGSPVFVSPETFEVVALAIDAWRATDGFFDPTLLDALIDVGYDRSFEELGHATPTAGIGIDRRPGPETVELDARARLIRTPPGLHLDLGGIGKGHAADRVFDQLARDGAAGACLDLGGDVRVGGVTVEGGGWVVVVDDPFQPGTDLALLGVGEGSVTTSSRLRRRWATDTGEAHHLLDPSTARPVSSDLASVTVLAALAAWGEVHAKAALIAGRERGTALIETAGLSALLVTDEGETIAVGGFEAFVVDRPTLGS